MKNLKILSTLLIPFLFIYADCGSPPPPATPFPITFQTDLEDWTVLGDNSNNSWQWVADGKTYSHNWNDRLPINSPSGEGAIALNSDSLSTKVTPVEDGTLSFENITPGTFRIQSPIYPLSESFTAQKAGLTFYQYFKQYEGKCSVKITVENGENSKIYPVNQSFGNFMETRPGVQHQVSVDISDLVNSNTNNIQIEFIYEGTGSFWIIDDVNIVSDITEFKPTFPAHLADTLQAHNYSYLTDSLGGAYIPDEYVVKYKPNISDAVRDSVRNKFQVIDYETCSCSDLELWKSPIVLTPTKVWGTEFPTEILDFNGDPSEISTDCSLVEDGYIFVSQSIDFCDTLSSNFTEHTTQGLSTNMLLINGYEGAGFNLPPIIDTDSFYLFSFYARHLPSYGEPEIQINVGGIPVDTVTITTSNPLWGRYDVHIPKGHSGIINFTQINDNGIYALDDLCLLVYESGDPYIDVNGVIEKENSSTEVEEIERNYRNFDLNNPSYPIATTPVIPSLPSLQQTKNETVIAILDTGIDYGYPNNPTSPPITQYLFNSQDNLCYEKDRMGYNFVDKNNMPFDDASSGHGTHIAGIIIKNMKLSTACSYKIMPVKTHDKQGMGTLFNVTCGISYAAHRGADYINASWGFYGEKSIILESTIRKVGTKDRTIVFCSAGNDTVDISTKAHWPSSYQLANLFTIGATYMDNTGNPKLDVFSNFSSQMVDFGTLGRNIESIVPYFILDPQSKTKSGTSMAAPRALAIGVMTNCYCDYSSASKPPLKTMLKTLAATTGKNVPNVKNQHFLSSSIFSSSLPNNLCTVSATTPEIK